MGLGEDGNTVGGFVQVFIESFKFYDNLKNTSDVYGMQLAMVISYHFHFTLDMNNSF